MTGPPPNWREGRQRFLVGFLRAALVAVIASSSAALILPDEAGHWAAVAMVSLLISVPILRVAWLGVRWARLGDRRFALTALGLIAVVASGALLAFS